MNDTSKAGTLEGMTLEGYELIGENQQLALYLREESASIRVVDKKSGYIWGALRQDKPDDLNKTWSAFANSIVSIMYYDEMGSTAKTGAGHQDNKCTFQKIENGVTVHVDFIEKDKSTKKESTISLSASVQLVDDHIRFSLDDSSIKENGDIVINRQKKEVLVTTLDAFPAKNYWEDLVKLLEENELNAKIAGNSLQVSWIM